MPLFRCVSPNCDTQGDFEAADPVCPTCKADGREHGLLIIPLVEVHYLVIDKAGPIKTAIGNRRIACMPQRAKLPKAASGERTAVNCSRCKASDVFKAHQAGEVDQHVPYIEQKLSGEHGASVAQA